MNNPKWNNIALNGTEHMFTAMVKVTRNPKGEGFVDYIWNKPTATGVSEQGGPKLSFEKAFKPLNWIIGNGIYIDNIDKAVEEKLAPITQYQDLGRFGQLHQSYNHSGPMDITGLAGPKRCWPAYLFSLAIKKIPGVERPRIFTR